MTNKEIADWFGIKEKSFRSTRKKKLKELEEYALFEDMRGKVNIIIILNSIYTKGSKDYKLIKEKTKEKWSKSGLDTCSFVSDKIAKECGDNLKVNANTLYSYTCTSKRELWGKAYGEHGEIGHCIYELCKEIDKKCIEFTEEEKAIKNKLLKIYFGNADEKVLYIRDMQENNEITKEESWDLLSNMMHLDKNYIEFKFELEKLLGCKVVRATRVFTNAF